MENWEVSASLPPKENSNKKKRKRITHTCSSCRSRKIKCDQGRPCTACVKKKIPAHLCIYEDSPFLPSSEIARDPKEALLLLTEENKRLKKQLDQFKTANLLPPSFFNNNQSTTNPNPNSDLNRKIKRNESLTVKKNRISYNGPSNWKALLVRDKEYKEIIDTAKTFVANAKKEWRIEKKIKKITNDEYKDIQSSTPEILLRSLSDYLPDYYTVKEYLNIFIKSYWYTAMPIVDSEMLFEDFHEIFEKKFDGSNKIKFSIKNKTIDYAKISVILCCIKLTIITKNLATINPNINLYDENDSLLRYVERLLNFSKYLVKVNLPALQTILLLFHLHRINPSESDGAGDGSNSVVSFKSALNMAVILGLNRDIEKLYSFERPKVVKLLKRIWVVILSCDACLSFSQGIPLGIEEDFINYDTLDLNNPWVQFGIGIRKASRLINQTKDCTVGEVLEVINDLEKFEKKTQLTKVIETMKTPNDFINSFETVDYIQQRLMSSYALHVLYQSVYLSFEVGELLREQYYNGCMKYGSLTVTHLIELLSRLTVKNLESSLSNLTKEEYTSKVYNIVEMSSSFTSLSRIVFFKTFISLCHNVLERLKLNNFNENKNDETLKLNVADFDSIDLKQTTTPLARALRSPSVLHGLQVLICKHLLYLSNESFGKVYGFNFCLYAIIALFKYFNNLLTKILTKDQLELTINKPTPSIRYNYTKDKCEAEAIESINLNKVDGYQYSNNYSNINNNGNNNNNNNSYVFLNPNYNNGLLNLPSSNHEQVDLNSSSSEINLNSNPTSSTDSTPMSLNNYDFFEWKNKPVDELFQNILMNDEIFTLDNTSQSFSWLLDMQQNRALNPGTTSNPTPNSNQIPIPIPIPNPIPNPNPMNLNNLNNQVNLNNQMDLNNMNHMNQNYRQG